MKELACLELGEKVEKGNYNVTLKKKGSGEGRGMNRSNLWRGENKT